MPRPQNDTDRAKSEKMRGEGAKDGGEEEYADPGGGRGEGGGGAGRREMRNVPPGVALAVRFVAGIHEDVDTEIDEFFVYISTHMCTFRIYRYRCRHRYRYRCKCRYSYRCIYKY